MALHRTRYEDLPVDLLKALQQTNTIVGAYLQGLGFILSNARHDPHFREQHLLTYLSQDLLQSAVSILSLAMEGMLSVAKRELRFVMEASIKLCFVQQNSYRATVAEKLTQFDKQLASQKISIKNNLELTMLPPEMRAAFADDVGRIYGTPSDYVHLSPTQINERIAAFDVGRTVGHETPSDIESLNDMTCRSFAASLVLLYHSVPEWVAGDWLVQSDGSTNQWFFTASRYISAIDSYFDYKHDDKQGSR
jgi:hypothetical protein